MFAYRNRTHRANPRILVFHSFYQLEAGDNNLRGNCRGGEGKNHVCGDLLTDSSAAAAAVEIEGEIINN